MALPAMSLMFSLEKSTPSRLTARDLAQMSRYCLPPGCFFVGQFGSADHWFDVAGQGDAKDEANGCEQDIENFGIEEFTPGIAQHCDEGADQPWAECWLKAHTAGPPRSASER